MHRYIHMMSPLPPSLAIFRSMPPSSFLALPSSSFVPLPVSTNLRCAIFSVRITAFGIFCA